MNKYLILILLAATVATAQQNVSPEMTHMWAQQRANTFLVDVTYSLSDPDSDELFVSLILLTGGDTVISPCNSVTGDVGSGVAPGANKHITWDAGADFSGQYGSDYTLRVVANDGVAPSGFVLVPRGTFIMGSPINEPGRQASESQHQVTLTHGLYVHATEVTNQQYRDMAQWAYNNGYVTATGASIRDNLDGSTQVLKTLGAEYYEITFNAGLFSCINPTHPVKYVNWYGSVAYCDWLNLQQNLPRAYNHSTWQCNGGNPYMAMGFRLPTEAEWEYACRAGSTTAFSNGEITQIYCDPVDSNLELVGWYCGNAGGWSHPVAQKSPNAWGLYDMHGNVYEWCEDVFSPYGGSVIDPVGAGPRTNRMFRGSGWLYYAQHCRSADRANDGDPGLASYTLGFRPVRSAD